MSASLDEAFYNFNLDAPANIGTNFYILVGDNVFGYTSSPNDNDLYAINLKIGHNYSIIAADIARKPASGTWPALGGKNWMTSSRAVQ
jgi:hypothetical protein